VIDMVTKKYIPKPKSKLDYNREKNKASLLRFFKPVDLIGQCRYCFAENIRYSAILGQCEMDPLDPTHERILKIGHVCRVPNE
jgi:hypothetical protein